MDKKEEHIKRYILEKIERKQMDFAKRATEAFGISLDEVFEFLKI